MSIQDTSGGTTTFAVPECSPFGTNAPPFAVQPSHGTVSVSENDEDITYVNNGDGATSDSFAWYDDEGEAITVSVTITSSAPTPIVVMPASAPNGHVGSAYSLQFTATGGNGGPYSYIINAGTLPAGVSDNAAGLISGTPTESGSFDFTETATDSGGEVGQRSITLVVSGPISISPASLPEAIRGVAYSQTLSASGGTTPYTFSRSFGSGSAALPPGLGLSAGGVLSGTPTSSGTTILTLVVTDANGHSAQQNYTFVVVSPQTITFNNPGTQNFGISPTLVATATSSLPVLFTSSTASVCTISGTGTLTSLTAGTCTISANQPGNAIYAAAPQVSQSFTVSAVVPSAPSIGAATASNASATVTFAAPLNNGGSAISKYTVTSNPNGIQATGTSSPITVPNLVNGTLYVFTVTATNSAGTGAASAASNGVTPVAPQTITFSNPGSQNLGAPLQLHASSSSGLAVSFVSTTPSVCTVTALGVLTTNAPGTCTITVNQPGNNAFLSAPQVTQSFAIVVPGGAVSLSTPSPLPVGTGGVPYSLTLISAGGAAPYTYTETGALPAGLSFTQSGVLSGTPTSAGTYTIFVTVTDAATQTAQKNYQLTINAPGITLTPTTLPSGQVTTAYPPITLSASGGSAPYSFAVTSGALPLGLTLSPAGVVSGVPTAPGSFNVTVTATDKFNFAGALAYTIMINQPAPIAVNDTASTSAGSSVTIPVTVNDTGVITSIAFVQAPANGTAALSGLNVVYTPANGYAGGDSFTYVAMGPGGTSGAATVTITVTAPTITVSLDPSLNLKVGVAYSGTFSASGGTQAYTYVIGDGSLPSGLNLSPSGALSGMPVAAGNGSFIVVAKDSRNFTGSQLYTITIAKGDQSIVFGAAPNIAVGGSGAVTATTTSGLLPSFNSSSPACSVSATGAINGVNAGTCEVTASQTGDANYNAATPVMQALTIGQTAGTTALSSSGSPSVYGQSVTFTAIVSGQSPTGLVTFADGSTTLGSASLSSNSAAFSTSTLSVGLHDISARYAGDSNNTASMSPTLAQTVNLARTNVTITPPASAMVGQAQTIAASVSVVTPGQGTPTGNIVIADNVGDQCVIVLPAADCQFTPTSGGNLILIATYAGDGNFATGTATATLTASLATGTLIVTSSANPSAPGQNVTFTATVVRVTQPAQIATITGIAATPTGTITLTDNGTLLTTLELNNGTASYITSALAQGSHEIIASYSGDANDAAATFTLNQSVNLPTPQQTLVATPVISRMMLIVLALLLVGAGFFYGKRMDR